jgi:NAD(P)-dependent dehydrogenase (short-subunit alcohol dehydrogenase family)
MSFKEKVCIVTGAAVGLGRAFCEQLLKQGAFVREKAVFLRQK